MRIFITAGPTREYLDPIRFISNASSGKMGFAIAAAAAERGHEVTLVSGPVYLPTPPGVTCIDVVSAEEMLETSLRCFENCDAAVMSAAVSDYRPTARVVQKMEREKGPLHLVLEPTPDICARLGAIKGRRLLMGFALEDHDHHARAEAKLAKKHCDAIVMNDPSNVGIDLARIQIFSVDEGWGMTLQGSKDEIAARLVSWLEAHSASTSKTKG